MSFDLIFVKLENIGTVSQRVTSLVGKGQVYFSSKDKIIRHVFIIYEVDLYLK